MISNKILAGLGILVLGGAIGFLGAATPVSTAHQESIQLIDTPLSIAPNDYAAQSLQMTKGQTIQITLSITNQTMFTFDIMNQSQFYLYNNCAPKCAQPLLGGNGSYSQQAGETSATQKNITVSPSLPYSGQFNAPTNGTYYFVFDNSIGPAWTNYLNQNATGHLAGQFSLSSTQVVNSDSVNWIIVGLGAAVTLAGGAMATAIWDPKSGPA